MKQILNSDGRPAGHVGPGAAAIMPGKGRDVAVRLKAREWSGLLLAVSHGVRSLRAEGKVPVAVVNEALRDVTAAVVAIRARMASKGGA